MFNCAGIGLHVERELYAVDDAQPAVLDALESIRRPGHFRATVAIEPLARGRAAFALAYTKSVLRGTPEHAGYEIFAKTKQQSHPIGLTPSAAGSGVTALASVARRFREWASSLEELLLQRQP